MRKRTLLMLAIIILTLFDYLATALGLLRGTGIELNPLARWVFDWSIMGGMSILALASILGITIVWVNIKDNFVYRAAIFLCGFKTAIAVYHILGILATGGIQ